MSINTQSVGIWTEAAAAEDAAALQEVSFLKFQFILFILISLLTTATITITAACGLPKIANAGSTGAAAKSTTGATAGAGQASL